MILSHVSNTCTTIDNRAKWIDVQLMPFPSSVVKLYE